MIHHISISARDPKHVAEVLAELMNGRCYPFPGRVKNSFIAVDGDAHGSMIEVYPETVMLQPGEGDAPVQQVHDKQPGYWPFHLLLSVLTDRATVERIGAREGWRTRLFGRGSPGMPPVFHVIEFWVENRLMIEVATPDMIDEYTHNSTYEKRDERGRAVRATA
jgi:hypothetical protein